MITIQYTKYLSGKWHIVASTFNMWTSGSKKNPSITYAILKTDPLTVLDEVQYQKRNKTRTITGFDTIDNNQFVWRGRGFLKIFSSKWKIIYIDSEILIIQFSSTLITSSGMDILLRDKQNIDSYKKQIETKPNLFNLDNVTSQTFKWLS